MPIFYDPTLQAAVDEHGNIIAQGSGIPANLPWASSFGAGEGVGIRSDSPVAHSAEVAGWRTAGPGTGTSPGGFQADGQGGGAFRDILPVLAAQAGGGGGAGPTPWQSPGQRPTGGGVTLSQALSGGGRDAEYEAWLKSGPPGWDPMSGIGSGAYVDEQTGTQFQRGRPYDPRFSDRDPRGQSLIPAEALAPSLPEGAGLKQNPHEQYVDPESGKYYRIDTHGYGLVELGTVNPQELALARAVAAKTGGMPFEVAAARDVATAGGWRPTEDIGKTRGKQMMTAAMAIAAAYAAPAILGVAAGTAAGAGAAAGGAAAGTYGGQRLTGQKTDWRQIGLSAALAGAGSYAGGAWAPGGEAVGGATPAGAAPGASVDVFGNLTMPNVDWAAPAAAGAAGGPSATSPTLSGELGAPPPNFQAPPVESLGLPPAGATAPLPVEPIDWSIPGAFQPGMPTPPGAIPPAGQPAVPPADPTAAAAPAAPAAAAPAANTLLGIDKGTLGLGLAGAGLALPFLAPKNEVNIPDLPPLPPIEGTPPGGPTTPPGPQAPGGPESVIPDWQGRVSEFDTIVRGILQATQGMQVDPQGVAAEEQRILGILSTDLEQEAAKLRSAIAERYNRLGADPTRALADIDKDVLRQTPRLRQMAREGALASLQAQQALQLGQISPQLQLAGLINPFNIFGPIMSFLQGQQGLAQNQQQFQGTQRMDWLRLQQAQLEAERTRQYQLALARLQAQSQGWGGVGSGLVQIGSSLLSPRVSLSGLLGS